MRISGIQQFSMKDFPNVTSLVIFTSKCNYRCPACHAKKILESEERIPEGEILDFLDSKKGWIEGVVICGGEPTLEEDLEEFLEKLRKRKLKIKLDTNGSNPEILKGLLEKKLVDYVAMDVKSPLEIYSEVSGTEVDKEKIKESIQIVSKFPDYEFRTTIFPVIKKDRMEFISPEEVGEITKIILEITGEKNSKYFLQKFKSLEKDSIIDERLSNENLQKEMQETPREHLEECLIEAKKFLLNSYIR